MTPPSIQSLTAKFLASPTSAEFLGGDFEPHESGGGFRADVSASWADASLPAGSKTPVPTFWSELVARTSVGLFPLALGHCPQQLTDLNAVLTLKADAEAKPQPISTTDITTTGWVEKLARKDPRAGQLWAAALDRLAGRYDSADAQLTQLMESADSSFRTVLMNERGAVAYAAGKLDEAERFWSDAGPSPVTQFNQGIAAFARGDTAVAATLLRSAAGQLPAGSGWSSLASLLALVSEN